MVLPFPLFDSAADYRSDVIGPVGQTAAESLSAVIVWYARVGDDWSKAYLEIARNFLASYVPIEGNINTFARFRAEIERFTLWLAIKHCRNPLELTDEDILAYLRFLENPDRQWVSAYNNTRVTNGNDGAIANPDWRPFWARTPKGTTTPQYDKNKTESQNAQIRAEYDAQVIDAYSAKATTLAAALRALGPFYKYLIKEAVKTGSPNNKPLWRGDMTSIISPVIRANKRFRAKTKIDPISDTFSSSHRLTERQWRFTLEAANEMRLTNPDRWTRAWFLIAFLKGNYLRVSELCRTPLGIPKMNDIKFVVESGCWVFCISGKGKKVRNVVLPDQFLEYLKIYRQSRGFSTDLPTTDDDAPLISKLSRFDKVDADPENQHDMSVAVSTVREEIDVVFNYAQSYIARQEIKYSKSFQADIEVLKMASAQWLRHTGAFKSIESGTDIQTLQVELGHVDPRSTQNQYSDIAKYPRADTARGRMV